MILFDPQGFSVPGNLGTAVAFAFALGACLGVLLWLGRAPSAGQPR